VKNPFSTANDDTRQTNVEKVLTDYCKKHDLMIIAGHTHKAVFPCAGQPNYFNDGCCVHPYGITAIEIDKGLVFLVKWELQSGEKNHIYIGREVLEGPRSLAELFA